MKIYTLIFETSGNGIYSESFKTKQKALNYLKDWDETEDMKQVIDDIKEQGYFYCDDDKDSWGIILEENELK
jgi:hypothetical protein